MSDAVLAEIIAMCEQIEADLKVLHHSMQDCIATMDRMIVSMQAHRRWLEEHRCTRAVFD